MKTDNINYLILNYMDKLLNDDERFVHLLLDPKHRETCLEFLRLGYPVSAQMISLILKQAPDLMNRILKIDFLIRSEWSYYDDCAYDDSGEIYASLSTYYGRNFFFRIVSEHPSWYGYFLNYFAEKDPQLVLSFLSEKIHNDDQDTVRAIVNAAPSLGRHIRKNLPLSLKEPLFKILIRGENFNHLELIDSFGLEFCIENVCSDLPFLEEAYWELEETEFWEVVRHYPKAVETLKSSTDRRILAGIASHNL